MRRFFLFCGLLALAAASVGCGDDDGDAGGAGGATTSTSSTTAGSTTSSTSGGVEESSVRVYLSRGETVGTAGRTVEAPAVARGALEALLDGPDDFEAGIGMATQIPAGTVLRDIDIDDGVATVDLSSEFQSGGGSLSMGLRVAQVVFTLTQFDTVDTVTILIDGHEVDGIGGEGVPATDLTRADFANVTPFILVESPTPGATVSSPLEVSGISNTFEANVRYAVTDPEGLILEEGSTTARAGNGEWGDFAVTVEFATERTGLGTVIVWQDDAQTGARRDVYEVPVRMP